MAIQLQPAAIYKTAVLSILLSTGDLRALLQTAAIYGFLLSTRRTQLLLEETQGPKEPKSIRLPAAVEYSAVGCGSEASDPAST